MGPKRKDVDRFEVDVFVMGHDWEGEFDFLKDKCEVIYLNRTEVSQQLRLNKNYMEKMLNNFKSIYMRVTESSTHILCIKLNDYCVKL